MTMIGAGHSSGTRKGISLISSFQKISKKIMLQNAESSEKTALLN